MLKTLVVVFIFLIHISEIIEFYLLLNFLIHNEKILNYAYISQCKN